MKTVWTEHLKDSDEIVQFEKSIKHSKWILEHLGVILGKIERGLQRQERSPKAYDNPNWEYRQAHANGYLQCLYDVKDLINLDQKDTK